MVPRTVRRCFVLSGRWMVDSMVSPREQLLLGLVSDRMMESLMGRMMVILTVDRCLALSEPRMADLMVDRMG